MKRAFHIRTHIAIAQFPLNFLRMRDTVLVCVPGRRRNAHCCIATRTPACQLRVDPPEGEHSMDESSNKVAPTPASQADTALQGTCEATINLAENYRLVLNELRGNQLKNPLRAELDKASRGLAGHLWAAGVDP
jgi:hypothetical protein